MAKLSAHGYELARLDYRVTEPANEYLPEQEYRFVLSFRSDGHIMRRMIAINLHRGYDGPRADHDYGWKLYKRLKDPKTDTRNRMLALFDKYLAAYGDKVTESYRI